SASACALLPLRAPPVISVTAPIRSSRAPFNLPTSLLDLRSRTGCSLTVRAQKHISLARPVSGKPVRVRRCPATVRGDNGPSKPPLEREGGSADDPQARRPAGRIHAVCFPRGKRLGTPRHSRLGSQP